MRISEHVLYDAIATSWVRISQPVENTIALRVFDQVIQVALFLVAKCFTITDKKLKVARVRLIDMRVVNLIDDAVAQSEPNAATGMVSCTYAFLGARSPARLDSRCAKRN